MSARSPNTESKAKSSGPGASGQRRDAAAAAGGNGRRNSADAATPVKVNGKAPGAAAPRQRDGASPRNGGTAPAPDRGGQQQSTRRGAPVMGGLHVADCVAFMRDEMAPGSVDLTVTSPPYDSLRNYKGYRFNFEEIAAGLFRVTADGGVVVWVVGDRINGGRSMTSFRQGIYFQELGFCVHDVMIYQKKNTPFMRSNAYTNAYEFMFVMSKGRPNTFNPIKQKTVRHGHEMLVHNKGPDAVNRKIRKELKKEKTRTNIWAYAVGLGGTTTDKVAFQHPAVFPEKLAEDHILSWTNPGDLVFDPMCGSGTTCKMALLHGRRYIGVDISPEYIQIATERLGLFQDVATG